MSDVDIAVVIRLMIAVFRAEQHDFVAFIALQMRHRYIEKAVFRHAVVIVRRRPCTLPVFILVLVEQAVLVIVQLTPNALLEKISVHVVRSPFLCFATLL